MVRGHSLRTLLTVLLCACPAAAIAQQETATIAGTVTDATGAVVPHAVVVATNVQTGISVRTTATDAGTYVIPSLRPGDYSIADIATFPWVARWPWHGLDNGLRDYPNVVRWYDAIRARPAVQRGYNVPASDQEIPAP